jgi:hypothetical protein
MWGAWTSEVCSKLEIRAAADAKRLLNGGIGDTRAAAECFRIESKTYSFAPQNSASGRCGPMKHNGSD